MNPTPAAEPALEKPLRLWPGVVVVALQWLARFAVPIVVPEAAAFGIIGGLVGGLAVVIWWAFFSRARRSERWGAIVLMIVAFAATSRVVDQSIAGGMMGLMLVVYAVPTMSLALVVWAAASRGWSDGLRRVSLVAAIVAGCGVWTLVRTGGMTGGADSDFAWRWAATAEERLLAEGKGLPAPIAPAAPAAAVSPGRVAEAAPTPVPVAAPTVAAWPGFRGPDRDGAINGVRIGTDWTASPPVELWHRAVGPGWSSFAVSGDLFYTQEQRGESEIAGCYRVSTGEPVWMHRDAARFWESNAGAGPRATPTLSGGRVFTLGATGIVNALDAANGGVVWTRNAASDSGEKTPAWGFAGSPLVVDDLVIVAVGGRLIAYERASGEQRWSGPAGGAGYSSPQLAMIHGVAQILLLSGTGVISVSPADGAPLWAHKWPGDGIVQPAVTADGSVLIGTGSGMGTAGTGVARIAVTHGAGGWSTEERWKSNGLKPYFNDFVVYAGHAFGFDGSILACIDLEDGRRKWKGGRYGYGQLVLLRDQGLLLVLSEQGELALVQATTDQFTELARLPAMDGKTWNHPVVSGDRLLVRNGDTMVAFRLPAERR